jgi:dTDP-4-dehydrorhamnose 3,5-epimerase
MKFIKTHLPGVMVIEPTVHLDERGFFLESYHQKKYQEAGISEVFVQDNHSRSHRGVLRGLHLQKNYPQGKLVRVIEGEVFDVCVDVRVGSPTFGEWFGLNLSAENFKQLYIPPQFAHGFCVLSETVQFEYKCTEFYHPEDEMGILWNDSDIGIKWPIKEAVLSRKDQGNLSLNKLINQLPCYGNSKI